MPSYQNEMVPCRDCKDKSCASAVLDLPEIDLINQNRTEKHFQKGNVFLYEGTMTSHIIYLKSGLVKEFVKSTGEKEQIVQIIKQFSYLGLPSLFGDRINHYSYAALTDITVCYIDHEVFKKLIRQNGNFAYEILVSVSHDSLTSFHRFMNQTQKKTFGRVADAILYFSKIIFEANEFEIPFTRQEFADLIGVSRESATRVLSELDSDGIVSLKNRAISILNLEKLMQVSRNG